jgi:hypothetical protein
VRRRGADHRVDLARTSRRDLLGPVSPPEWHRYSAVLLVGGLLASVFACAPNGASTWRLAPLFVLTGLRCHVRAHAVGQRACGRRSVSLPRPPGLSSSWRTAFTFSLWYLPLCCLPTRYIQYDDYVYLLI